MRHGPFGIAENILWRTPIREWTPRASFVASRSNNEERWHVPAIMGTAPATAAPAKDSLRAVPFVVPRDAVVDKIAFSVTTGGSGSVARIGIYGTDHGNWYPTTLIFDGGEKTTTGTGVFTSLCCVPLDAHRLYWLAYHCDANGFGAVVPTVRSQTNNSAWPIGGWEDTGGTTPGNYLVVAQAYASAGLPNPFPGGATFPASSGPLFPLIGMRLSA